MFIRKCPTCGCDVIHKSKSYMNDAIRLKIDCKKCGIEKRRGFKHTDETKKKLSELKSGKSFSDEHKLQLSIAKKGCKLSDTHKENIGKSLKGLIRSESAKKKYSESKIGDRNPAKRPEVREKIRNSIKKLYEDKPEIKERISESLTKYFEENPQYVNLKYLNEYELFRKKVDNLTNRTKNKLFELWDGIDYYDNEYIKDYLELDYNDKKYPTIDHKISILKGFKEGYTAEEIGDIGNLCITKRKLNSKKSYLDDVEFFERLSKELS